MGGQNSSFSDFFKILYLAACKCFLVFNAAFDVRWIFVAQDVSRVIFKGSILGGVHHFGEFPTETVLPYSLIQKLVIYLQKRALITEGLQLQVF